MQNRIIGADQKDEVATLFSDMKKTMQSTDAYKLMEPIRKQIPENMLKMTPDITYEDAMIMTFAVQASNIKKAGKFFGATFQ